MKTTDPRPTSAPAESSHFLRNKVLADLASNKYGGRVVTRFPPEPNGWLHIGHAKSICLNFGLAAEFGGRTHLRMDDTNPTTEDPSYVEAIGHDVRWLGFEWHGEVRYASDYFEEMYAYAVELIKAGKAYVCELSEEEMRAWRGTVSEPGRESPGRARSVEENLDLFARMRRGEFPDGRYTLRARMDMSHPNMKMRDAPLYRIRHAHHYRTGDAWCIYPMYDYGHPLSDAIEDITHSICTLEFENNRDIYDWVLRECGTPARPEQSEFARLAMTYTLLSKRYLRRLVEDKLVDGWDDPRMPTIAGIRRRGVTPEALRSFCDKVGIAKANSVVDITLLEGCIRDDLHARAPRVMAVLDPLKVVIENWPEGAVEMLTAPSFPAELGKPGERSIPFGRELYIEREDFSEDPPKGFHRLVPGGEVRLRYGWIIKCERVIKDEAGEIVELRASYDPATRSGSGEGRKVKGTIHWVPAEGSLPAEVRLYDRLFKDENPTAENLSSLNPNSLVVRPDARVEPSVAGSPEDARFQFERLGFFCVDRESSAGRLVFNRTIGLKDSWAAAPRAEEERKPSRAAAPPSAPTAGRAPVRAPDEEARYTHLRGLGLSDTEASVLASEEATRALFEGVVKAGAPAKAAASWVVGELRKDGETLTLEADALAELVLLVEEGTLTTAIGRTVLEKMLAGGGRARDIVEREGLRPVSDEGELTAHIHAVLEANPAQLAKLRDGNTNLLGFFVGAVMKRTGGRADARRVTELLKKTLG